MKKQSECTSYGAIPTMFRSTLFRSRLEARWASLFDLCTWRWEYEPFDLKGYIPDFLLPLKTPILVEVKPALSIEDFKDAKSKIEESGWTGHALCVGAFPVKAKAWPLDMALTIGAYGELFEGRWYWSDAWFFVCRQCAQFAVCSAGGAHDCHTSGCHSRDGFEHIQRLTDLELLSLWRGASNRVQWRGRPEEKIPAGG